MDEKEHEEILWRLDERTKRVDDHLNRLDRRLDEVEMAVDGHEKRISENEDNIETAYRATKGFGASLLALLSGIGAKVMGILSI